MNLVKSFYLEWLRIIAAFYVFIYHIGSETINNKQYLSNEVYVKKLGLNYPTAHCFVMIFFVLSGYLITMSASKPNITFRLFITNRLGRLYSVLIPALVFSFITAYFFKYSGYPIGKNIENMSMPLPRALLNFFFLGQAYILCSVPPFNGAFWSVQYEFIYYLYFGFVFILKKWWKYCLLIGLFFISILKVFLLLPIWLAGSLLFFLEKKIILKNSLAISIFIISTISLIYYLSNSSSMPFQKDTSDNNLYSFHLFYSWNFIADYIFTIIVFLNMYSFFQISNRINMIIGNTGLFKNLYKKSTIVGNCTYTLYLFHTPLLFLYATILPFNRLNNFHVLSLILLVLISVFFIARFTEWKVQFWRNIVDRFFSLLIKG